MIVPTRAGLRTAFSDNLGGPWQVRTQLPVGYRPQIALDARGDAIAIWAAYGSRWGLQSSFKPAGSAWGPPVELSGSGGFAEGGDFNGPSRLEVNARGDAIVVWNEEAEGFPTTHPETMAAVMPHGSGSWGAPVQLSKPPGTSAFPAAAIDSQGNVLVAWRMYNRETAPFVEAVTGSATVPGGAWGAPETISAPGEEIEEDLRVALGPQGDAAALWTRASTDCGIRRAWSAVATTRAAGSGSWSHPAQISPAGECPLEPQLAIDGKGDATALWSAVRPQEFVTLEAVEGSVPRAAWRAPRRLAVINSEPLFPNGCYDACPGPPTGAASLEVNAAGTALTVWRQEDGDVYASLRSGDGEEWQHPRVLSEPTNAYGPRLGLAEVALSPRGEAIATWGAGDFAQADVLLDQRLLRNADLTKHRFRVPRRARGKQVGGGTRLRFELAAPARLRIAIFGFARGSLSGVHCVPPPAQPPRKAPRRCTRREFLGALAVRKGRHAAGSFRFDGRIDGKNLKPGSYEAELTALRGRAHSIPVALPFTILPSR